MLVLYDKDLIETGRFFWSPDSTIHYATGTGPNDDKGPIVPTRVQFFRLRLDPVLTSIVHIDTLLVHSTTGQTVQMKSSLTLFNAP